MKLYHLTLRCADCTDVHREEIEYFYLTNQMSRALREILVCGCFILAARVLARVNSRVTCHYYC